MDIASYASVPQLVRIFANKERNWNFYGLITTIEVERHAAQNPAIPDWLLGDYKKAIETVLAYASEDLTIDVDEQSLQAILGAIAAAKGNLIRARLMGLFTDDELEEMLEVYSRY